MGGDHDPRRHDAAGAEPRRWCDHRGGVDHGCEVDAEPRHVLDVVTPPRRADRAHRAPLPGVFGELVHPDHRPAGERPPDPLPIPVLDERNQLVVADLLDEVGHLLGKGVRAEDCERRGHGR